MLTFVVPCQITQRWMIWVDSPVRGGRTRRRFLAITHQRTANAIITNIILILSYYYYYTALTLYLLLGDEQCSSLDKCGRSPRICIVATFKPLTSLWQRGYFGGDVDFSSLPLHNPCFYFCGGAERNPISVINIQVGSDGKLLGWQIPGLHVCISRSGGRDQLGATLHNKSEEGSRQTATATATATWQQ